MNTLFDIVKEVFGLGKDLYNSVNLDELKKQHKRLVARTIWILTIIIILMVLLNYFGLEKANLLISLFLCLLAAVILTRPEPLIAVSAIGIVSGVVKEPEKIADEIKKSFSLYFRTVGDVILWIAIFGMFLGTISCRNNPLAIAGVAVTLIVIGIGSCRWGFTTGLYKKIIFSYAVILLIVSLLSFIPSHTQIRFIGYDFGALFHTPKYEIALSNVEKAQQERFDKDASENLSIIEKKIENGEELTEKEKIFLQGTKEMREKNTLVNRMVENVSALHSQAEAAVETTRQRKTEADRQQKTEAKVETEDLRGEWNLSYKKAYEGESKEAKISIKEAGESFEMGCGDVVFYGKKTAKGYEGIWRNDVSEGKFHSLVFATPHFGTGIMVSNNGTNIPINLYRD